MAHWKHEIEREDGDGHDETRDAVFDARKWLHGVVMPAGPSEELMAFAERCQEALSRGNRIVSYRCEGCKQIQESEFDRGPGYASREVQCLCGHVQVVHKYA